jgi:peptidoglycan/xylan/chitin deacetylase (PgdA/CDA1 family)
MNTSGYARLARIGLLFNPELARQQHAAGRNTFQVYIGEVLAHAGFTFDWLADISQATPDQTDILIVALAGDDPATAERVWQFASMGGTVIVLPNHHTLADRLNCTATDPVGVGYAVCPGTPAEGTPLRFMHAEPWKTTQANVETIGVLYAGSPAGEPIGPVVIRAQVGAGMIERWAVDVGSTVVALQQGLGPVTQDGLPAPDGSAALNEGILKADDGFTLDWLLDRRTTATGQPYFAYPYADLWREVFLQRLLRLAMEKGLALPFIDYCPQGVESIALISHDSDLNDNDSAITTLHLEQEAGIHSTWCIIEPGYAPGIYEQIQAQGHELAFHYNSVEHENYKWDAADFTRQLEWFKQATGRQMVASNKNHYTRFEGWGEFFRWLEQAGIGLDQTRGPSKRGNVGMLFSTCHPFHPIAWYDEGNRCYDVLELGFLTQDMDLGAWADSSVIAPFIDQVQRVRGVAHFLFHPVHLHQQEAVRQAFAQVIGELRQRGFAFWTSEQINAWERARRKLRIEAIDSQGRARFTYAGLPQAAQAVVWLPVSDTNLSTAQRFGVACRRAEVVS